MKRISHSILAGILLMPGLAMAHAHLEKSVPAANSSVAAMPAQVILNFSEAVRVTALTIEKQGGAPKVELKPPADARAEVRVEAPKLEAGAYLMSWRGLGKDGHVMNGTVHFTVSGK